MSLAGAHDTNAGPAHAQPAAAHGQARGRDCRPTGEAHKHPTCTSLCSLQCRRQFCAPARLAMPAALTPCCVMPQAAQMSTQARPRFTPQLLNMRHVERNLAEQRNFTKANTVGCGCCSRRAGRQ